MKLGNEEKGENGFISTLLYSFGSEAPAEVIWGLNELIDWIKDEHGITIEYLCEPYSEEAEHKDYDEERIVNEINDALNKLGIINGIK